LFSILFIIISSIDRKQNEEALDLTKIQILDKKLHSELKKFTASIDDVPAKTSA